MVKSAKEEMRVYKSDIWLAKVNPPPQTVDILPPCPCTPDRTGEAALGFSEASGSPLDQSTACPAWYWS